MKLITLREIIKSTPDRYKRDQGKYWETKLRETGKTRAQMHAELLALDLDNCTKEDVNKIMGNSSWTNLTCDECKQNVDKVVQLGEEPDYESSTASICFSCLTKAVKLV